MNLPARAAALTALVLLAACGSSTPHHAAPTAAGLARRIPGCGTPAVNTPSVLEIADVTCTMASEQVTIATFATAADEKKWIADGGYPADPDPIYAGCCVQGHLWAATVDGITYDFGLVIKVLGGRRVSG